MFFVELEDGFGLEFGGGVLFYLLADLVDFGGETDEQVGHGVADLFGVADDDALAVAQDDVAWDTDDGRVVRDAAQNDGSGADPAVVADGNVA